MDFVIYRGFVDELKKIAGIPPKLLLDPRFAKYFERVERAGKDAPRLFRGGPKVHIPGISPPKKAKV